MFIFRGFMRDDNLSCDHDTVLVGADAFRGRHLANRVREPVRLVAAEDLVAALGRAAAARHRFQTHLELVCEKHLPPAGS
jgi:hypothetical protein